jgi:hypothetical protein
MANVSASNSVVASATVVPEVGYPDRIYYKSTAAELKKLYKFPYISFNMPSV